MDLRHELIQIRIFHYITRSRITVDTHGQARGTYSKTQALLGALCASLHSPMAKGAGTLPFGLIEVPYSVRMLSNVRQAVSKTVL